MRGKYPRNKDKIVTEKQAFAYHKGRYKIHTFIIDNLEEYNKMRPFIVMLGFKYVKVISRNPEFRGKDFEELRKKEYMKEYQLKYKAGLETRKAKEDEGLATIWGKKSRFAMVGGSDNSDVKDRSRVASKSMSRELRKLDLSFGRKI